MNNLYEVLEVCLNEIERGTDVDTVLFRYPELADELRPIVEASVGAKEMAVPAPSQEVIKRNRARILQRASEIREQSAVSSRRIWSVPLRRALVTLMVIMMLFVSSTGLVRASSSTLPGDNLYPVKRTWEDVLLLFTFDTDKREALEFEHENERLEELHELFAEGRSANVDFAGYVTRQNGTEWRVSGITVVISSETRLPDQPIEINAAVRVQGRAQSDMSVLAETIELLPSGSRLPEIEDDEDELEGDSEEHEGSNLQIAEIPNTGSENETPETVVTTASTPETVSDDVSINGIITSVENDLIVVDGIVMDVEFVVFGDALRVGGAAKVEGYYNADGIFIVTKIEVEDSSSGNISNSNDDEDDDNHNDDH